MMPESVSYTSNLVLQNLNNEINERTIAYHASKQVRRRHIA